MMDEAEGRKRCLQLQERLRRYCGLAGVKVYELPNGTVFCDGADITLVIYAEPYRENGYIFYGFIGYRYGGREDSFIDDSNVQYLSEKLEKEIAIMEQ